MAAAVSADPYDRCDAVLAFWCSPTSRVIVLLVKHDATLFREDTEVVDDDDDDDDARMALIPNDSVADDVT